MWKLKGLTNLCFCLNLSCFFENKITLESNRSLLFKNQKRLHSSVSGENVTLSVFCACDNYMWGGGCLYQIKMQIIASYEASFLPLEATMVMKGRL